MIETRSPFRQLIDFTRGKMEGSLTGQLLGLGLPARDEILDREVLRFESDLAIARTTASDTGEPIAIAGAGISLTDGGDTWTIYPDGRMARAYSRFEAFDAFLGQIADRPGVDFSKSVQREVLLEAVYQAFWSPSATNWQPTRVLEIVGERRDALCRIAGWPPPPAEFPLLVLLRRDHYESLLGDVLEPFGLEVTAREESIDAGIFSHSLMMGALAQGLTAQEYEFDPSGRDEARPIIHAELASRLAALTLATDPMLCGERTAIARLVDYLERGKFHPDALVAIGHPLGPVTPYPEFARIVSEHSTQRVASPVAEFGHDAVMRIWEVSRDTLPVGDRDLVKFADFSWHEQVPRCIGRAMFESLYGLGADPDSKAGGDGGILTAVTVRNYLLFTAQSDPDYVLSQLGEGWQEWDDATLRRVAKELPFRGQDLGRYMLERILRDGKYVVQGDRVVDADGKPLTVPLLVRMMKSLAATFGNFFLKFQNTHPQNAVLLADVAHPDIHHVYRAVGKVAAVLTFLSRAQGASSIIKSGPIDLARDPIGTILADNLDDLAHLRPWRESLRAGRLLPALTFQVGMPLAGSDMIDVGTPGEHSGYEERKRDKRPPREDFTWHYFPAL